MPELRLTKTTVEAIPLEASGQVLYRDKQLQGFGLRVGTRAKTYFVEGQVNRRTVRTTIGRADVFTPDIARKKALQLLSNMAEGKNPNTERRRELAENATLASAFDAFFRNRTQMAPSSVDGYTRTLNLYLADWSKRPLRDISRQLVLKRHQHLTQRHGAYTANTAMRHLRSVYNFVAATHEDLPPNPVFILTQARSWNRERRRQTVIEALQLPAWWAAVQAQSPLARDFLTVALFTGMRRNEIARLRWDHVDLIGKALHIPHTKNGDPLDLPLCDFLCEVISARRELVGQSEWVFPGPGRTGHIVEVKGFVNRVSEASGVKFTLHDLRRTFITIAESLDIPHYALKRLLNHRSGGDVTGGYIVINSERLRAPMEAVSKRTLNLINGKTQENL